MGNGDGAVVPPAAGGVLQTRIYGRLEEIGADGCIHRDAAGPVLHRYDPVIAAAVYLLALPAGGAEDPFFQRPAVELVGYGNGRCARQVEYDGLRFVAAGPQVLRRQPEARRRAAEGGDGPVDRLTAVVRHRKADRGRERRHQHRHGVRTTEAPLVAQGRHAAGYLRPQGGGFARAVESLLQADHEGLRLVDDEFDGVGVAGAGDVQVEPDVFRPFGDTVGKGRDRYFREHGPGRDGHLPRAGGEIRPLHGGRVSADTVGDGLVAVRVTFRPPLYSEVRYLAALKNGGQGGISSFSGQAYAAAEIEAARFEEDRGVQVAVRNVAHQEADVIGFANLEFHGCGEDDGLPVVFDHLEARADPIAPAAVRDVADAGEFIVEVERGVRREVDVIDAYRLVGVGDGSDVDRSVAEGAAEAGPADEEAENIVEGGVHELTVFLGGEDVAKGHRRLQGNKVKLQAGAVVDVSGAGQGQVGVVGLPFEYGAQVGVRVGAGGVRYPTR